jgi:anti-anti-sigma factor
MNYKLDMIRSPGATNTENLNESFLYVVRLSGNFVMEVSDEFNLLLFTLIAGGMKKVVFDLGDLKYIDSTGIGIFINITKKIRAKGGDLALFNVAPSIQTILQTVKLQDFIPCFKGEKQVSDHFFRR